MILKLIGKIPYTKDGKDKWILYLACDVSEKQKQNGAEGFQTEKEFTEIDCTEIKIGDVEVGYETSPFSNFKKLESIENVKGDK